LLEASIDGAHGVLLLVQGASDLGLHEIDEAARLVQEAVSPEANIIYGTTIDDTLGDEVRITVIAAGFDGGQPQVRKVERKPFSTPTTAAAAPAAAASTGWYAGAANPATEAIDTQVPSAFAAKSTAEEGQFFNQEEDDDALIPSSSVPQSADGTWGDDLDIPDFLR
jgi:cell division protein FtsZ